MALAITVTARLARDALTTVRRATPDRDLIKMLAARVRIFGASAMIFLPHGP